MKQPRAQRVRIAQQRQRVHVYTEALLDIIRAIAGAERVPMVVDAKVRGVVGQALDVERALAYQHAVTVADYAMSRDTEILSGSRGVVRRRLLELGRAAEAREVA